jgi:hypothetical protein
MNVVALTSGISGKEECLLAPTDSEIASNQRRCQTLRSRAQVWLMFFFYAYPFLDMSSSFSPVTFFCQSSSSNLKKKLRVNS